MSTRGVPSGCQEDNGTLEIASWQSHWGYFTINDSVGMEIFQQGSYFENVRMNLLIGIQEFHPQIRPPPNFLKNIVLLKT